MSSLIHHRGNNNIASYTWVYDSASRITDMSSSDDTAQYSYDASGQLTGSDHSAQGDESYSYDVNGNRTSSGANSGYVPIAYNRLRRDGTYEYEYDNEGNPTKATRISDQSTIEYTWDYRNV